jgi:AAA+ ATPase superfamily predicted ATPase
MAFFNRIDELAALGDLWSARAAQLFVLWGRRRVGKTELLSHFADGRRAFHYEATNVTRPEQLRDLSVELARVSGNALLAEQPASTWEAALAAIAQFAHTQRSIVILDEFQFLAAQEPGIGSIVNRWWRETGRSLPIVLVLAGSEVGFFEREVLGGELYGRRTGQLQILPLQYRDAALFHPGYSPEDRVRTFAICGGMPYYLERFTDDAPLERHILAHTLYREGLLFQEADLLLRQELPDPRNHTSVLRAIAQGQTRNSQVANRTQLSESQVTQIVATLERMQLVRTLRPVTAAERSKKTSYEIRDSFLNYHFRFVDPARSRLRNRAQAEAYLGEVVLPQLDHFVSKGAWEHICQEYVLAREDSAAVGSWWGQVPTGQGRMTRSQEIDIVAIEHDGRVTATGSCKWTDGKLSMSEERLLLAAEPFIPKAGDVARHYFCSREGFERNVLDLAAADPERYRLVTPADVYAAG